MEDIVQPQPTPSSAPQPPVSVAPPLAPAQPPAPVQENVAPNPIPAPTAIPVSDVAPPPPPAPAASPLTQSAAAELSKPANPMAIPPRPMPAKPKAPVGVITTAIAIAVVLSVTTVFAYIKMNGTTPNASHTAGSNNSATSKVSSSDVGQTERQLDDSLKTVDDAKDFGTADLSDATLGL